MPKFITKKNGDLGPVPSTPESSGHGSGQESFARNQFDARMDRLWFAAGVRSDADLARILGIKQQSVSSARSRKQLPLTWITELSERFRISADWLLYGTGSKDRPGEIQELDKEKSDQVVPAEQRTPSTPRSFSERLLSLIVEQAKSKPVDFARRAGIAPSLLYHYIEKGGITPQHVALIRDAFGVNPDWLMTGKGERYLTNEQMGIARQGDFIYNMPEPDAPAPKRSPASQLSDLLALAEKVLTSGSAQAADALEKTILSLAHAVEMDERISSLEARLKGVEEMLKRGS